MRIINHRTLSLFLMSALLLMPALLHAQEDQDMEWAMRQPAHTRVKHIMYPGPCYSSPFVWSAGVALTILPRTIVEEEVRQAPMLDVNMRLSLPANFMLTARLGTNYLTYLGSLGAQWNHSFGNLSVGIADRQTFWYGFSSLDGFDVNAQGWMNHPSLSAGYYTHDFTVTIKGEIDFLTFQKTVAGDVPARSNRNMLNGGSLTFAVEQPFWKNQRVVLGASAHLSRQVYQGWLAFSTFDKLFLYPEFFMGFVL